jgi:hypothetical protein
VLHRNGNTGVWVGHIVASRAPGSQAQNGVSNKQASIDANGQLSRVFQQNIIWVGYIPPEKQYFQLNGTCRDEHTLSLVQLP